MKYRNSLKCILAATLTVLLVIATIVVPVEAGTEIETDTEAIIDAGIETEAEVQAVIGDENDAVSYTEIDEAIEVTDNTEDATTTKIAEKNGTEATQEKELEIQSEETVGEDATGLSFWSADGMLADGSKITVSLNFTPSTTFDGRKHVLSVNLAKNNAEVAPSASQNPDIEVKNFAVSVNGTKAEGITLKSCTLSNNTNPGTMTLTPVVNYGKDDTTKQLLAAHKDFKTVLTTLLKPSKKYDSESEDYYWTNGTGPVSITINQITLDSTTPVYNLKGMSKEDKAKLAKKDGVLVWNGTKQNITFKTRNEKEPGEEDDNGRVKKWITYTFYIPTKATVPGLYYQRVFDLGNGKTAMKKINLKAGGWNLKSQTYNEDGYKETIYWMEATSGACDYYCSEPDAEGGYGKDEKPTSLSLVLNTEGRTVTKYKKVDDDYEDYEVEVSKPGFFTGTLPDIEYSSDPIGGFMGPLYSDSLSDKGFWDYDVSYYGENKSPDIYFQPVDGAKAYAVFMVDTSAKNWLHWKGQIKAEQLEDKRFGGKIIIGKGFKVIEKGFFESYDWEEGGPVPDSNAYVGPYPPKGTHTYVVYVIAMKEEAAELSGNFNDENNNVDSILRSADKDKAGNAGNIIDTAKISGKFSAK